MYSYPSKWRNISIFVPQPTFLFETERYVDLPLEDRYQLIPYFGPILIISLCVFEASVGWFHVACKTHTNARNFHCFDLPIYRKNDRKNPDNCNFKIQTSGSSYRRRNYILLRSLKTGMKFCVLCHVILLCCYASVFNDRWMFLFIALYSFSTDIKKKSPLNKIITPPSFMP